MNTSRFFDIMASVVVVALVTTLVLPGRQTGNVITAGSSGFANVLKAAQGR